MNILFISPSVKQSASPRYPDGIPRSISKNFGVYPWLGLCYLSSYLARAGIDSKVVDMDAEALTLRTLMRRVSVAKPDLIGLSTISFTFPYALRIAREIKRHFAIPVVIGGPHVSLYPKEVAAHDCIDAAVVGEGEETFLELARAFAGKGKALFRDPAVLSMIRGLAFKTESAPAVSESRPFIADIDSLPFPAVEKLKLQAYFGCNHVKPYMTMVTVRGCPYTCSFCSKEPWGKVFRFHSPARIVDELEYYVKRLGIRAVDFYDDTFTSPRSRALEIASLMRSRNLKVDFGMMTRVDCVDRELLVTLKGAGCKVIAYGVEFAAPRIQEKVNKKFSPEVVREAFRLASEVGLSTVGFFMVGHPDETEEDIRETIAMIKGLKADYVKANILIPYPGSQLYQELLSSGRLKVDFWAELTRGNIPSLKTLMVTKVSMSRLVKLRNHINRLPYLRRSGSNLLKVKKIKLLQDIKRTAGILCGSFFDRQV